MDQTILYEVTRILTALYGAAPTQDEIDAAVKNPQLFLGIDNVLVTGQSTYTTTPNDDLSTVMEQMASNGGGILNLAIGTYGLASDVIIPSNVQINGAGSGLTIIDTNGYQLLGQGINVYTTGTIASITGTSVVGLGTAWATNAVAGQYIFLGVGWYPIAAVTSDTGITLGQPYPASAVVPSAYRIATITSNIALRNMTIENSASAGIGLTDCHRIVLDNVTILTSDSGISLTNCDLVSFSLVLVNGCTNDGIDFSNGSLCDWNSVNVEGNGGAGLGLANVQRMVITPGDFTANAANGITMTDCSEIDLLVSVDGNGGKGIETVSGCDNINIYNSGIRGNVAEGIKFTATTTVSKIYASEIVGNGTYGVNIAAASDALNIVALNIFASNGTAAANDSGTTTLIRSNQGLADN